MAYEKIDFVRFQRVTWQDMMHIQTQYRNCESVRKEDALPAVAESVAGDIVFLNSDGKFYGFDGIEWKTIGDSEVQLPISDNVPLLQNSVNNDKQARFDLSAIYPGNIRVFTLPDKSGIIATIGDVPTIGGTVEGAALYRISDKAVGGFDSLLIGKSLSEDVFKYTDSKGINSFRVENDGKTVVRRLVLFSGGDG
jgi:hypothetical protein